MDSKNFKLSIKNKIFLIKLKRKKRILYYLYFFILIIVIIILFKFIIIRIYNNIEEFNNEQNNKENKELREKMFKALSRRVNKNITSLDDVYIGYYYKLGNGLLALNKVIYYCEILQCKRIFLYKNSYPLIKNTIYDKKFNLKIEILPNYPKKDIKSLFLWPNPYYTTLIKLPENRFDVFKKEILNNLPKPSININDLYIHIRDGDVYKEPFRGRMYAQPPLCFYKKIIEFKNFTNIYILAVNEDYPIIQKLINEYKNIKYNKNSLIEDVSKLVYAYNIVTSISSFTTCLIKLNDNLKNLFEYDFYHRIEKNYHLHHSISNFTRKYTIYQMKPSLIYEKKMRFWNRTDEQLNIMINDTCPNNFTIIKPYK